MELFRETINEFEMCSFTHKDNSNYLQKKNTKS